jgi:hypothetical protein
MLTLAEPRKLAGCLGWKKTACLESSEKTKATSAPYGWPPPRAYSTTAQGCWPIKRRMCSRRASSKVALRSSAVSSSVKSGSSGFFTRVASRPCFVRWRASSTNGGMLDGDAQVLPLRSVTASLKIKNRPLACNRVCLVKRDRSGNVQKRVRSFDHWRRKICLEPIVAQAL